MRGFSLADWKAAVVFVVLWVWLGCTELIWAGPVREDWVEPVWFLLHELCCLCRVFVPALQAPTVINSPGSLCMLTHTDKKWWRERWTEGGNVREVERGEVTGRHVQWHTVCWHRQTTAWTQRCKTSCTHLLKAINYKNGKAQEIYNSAFLGVKFQKEGSWKKRDCVHTRNF